MNRATAKNKHTQSKAAATVPRIGTSIATGLSRRCVVGTTIAYSQKNTG